MSVSANTIVEEKVSGSKPLLLGPMLQSLTTVVEEREGLTTKGQGKETHFCLFRFRDLSEALRSEFADCCCCEEGHRYRQIGDQIGRGKASALGSADR